MTAIDVRADADPADREHSVLVIAQGAPEIGGIPTFVDGMLTPGFFPEGIRVEYLNTTRAGEQRTGAGRPSLANVLKTLQDTRQAYARARNVDVVHLHTSPLPLGPLLRAVAMAAAGRLAGAAVVCHMHASFEPRAGSFDPSGRYLRCLPLLSAATMGVAVSNQAAEFLAEHVPGWPVRTVLNAVDAGAFDIADPRSMPPTLVFVGRLMVGKGLLDLIEALRITHERGVRLRTILVGPAPNTGAAESASVADAVEGSGLDITMAGAKSGPEVRAELAAADIFVLPSHFEGQPISVLEAMAAGLPIIATDVGANAAVLRDGIDGIVVPPHAPTQLADALGRLAADPDLRAEMGRAARLRVAESFSLQRLSSDLADIYQQALDRQRTRKAAGRAPWRRAHRRPPSVPQQRGDIPSPTTRTGARP